LSEQKFLQPAEIAQAISELGIKKAGLDPLRQMLLAILAGAFIALASAGSNMAAFNLLGNPGTVGLGKVLAGAVFGTGLMLVVLAGGELFTGNLLMLVGALHGKIRIWPMLRNWIVVYAGNFLGSILIAAMMANTGLFDGGANALGGVTIKIAAYKTGLAFLPALLLGILCNWLVCLAVWLANGAHDMTGKILAIFFPIWLFITSGFEHSVANMYSIPAGIFAKLNANWAQASALAPDKLAALNWGSFMAGNLLPVTLGNVIGGGIFVAAAYWFIYLKPNESRSKSFR
jgi:formate transporter